MNVVPSNNNVMLTACAILSSIADPDFRPELCYRTIFQPQSHTGIVCLKILEPNVHVHIQCKPGYGDLALPSPNHRCRSAFFVAVLELSIGSALATERALSIPAYVPPFTKSLQSTHIYEACTFWAFEKVRMERVGALTLTTLGQAREGP